MADSGELTSSARVRVHEHDVERLPAATRFGCDFFHRAASPAEADGGPLGDVHSQPAAPQHGRLDDARQKNL